MTELFRLLADPPFDYSKENIYARKIAGRFARHSPAVFANTPPPDMDLFDSVEHADSFIEAAIMDGDPDVEITDAEWEQAAERLINYINQRINR